MMCTTRSPSCEVLAGLVDRRHPAGRRGSQFGVGVVRDGAVHLLDRYAVARWVDMHHHRLNMRNSVQDRVVDVLGNLVAVASTVTVEYRMLTQRSAFDRVTRPSGAHGVNRSHGWHRASNVRKMIDEIVVGAIHQAVQNLS